MVSFVVFFKGEGFFWRGCRAFFLSLSLEVISWPGWGIFSLDGMGRLYFHFSAGGPQNFFHVISLKRPRTLASLTHNRVGARSSFLVGSPDWAYLHG
jgi:hypothetical protein